MKPTPEQIIELAREAGFEFDKATKYEPPQLINRGKHALPAFERFATLLLERFGAGGGEPVLVVEKEPDYWSGGHFYKGDKPHINPTKVWGLSIGTKLYTHPSPTDLRAEYERGLEDAKKEVEQFNVDGVGAIVDAIEALKGKQ